jgi:hypothetical protein
LFIVAAAIVVWLNRRKMFQRGEGIVDVLVPEKSAGLAGQKTDPEAADRWRESGSFDREGMANRPLTTAAD